MILPLLLYFTVKYLTERKVYQLVLVILFAGLFGSFHTSGIYLPAIAGLAVVGYLIHGLIKKYRIQWSAVALGGGIVASSVVAFIFLVLMPTIAVYKVYALWEEFNLIRGIQSAMSVPLDHYLLGILSLSVLLLVALAGVYYKEIIRGSTGRTKIMAVLLACTGAVLAVAAFARISLDPFRQAVDFATIMALLVALFIGLLLNWRDKVVLVVVILAVGFGLFHNLPTWFNYNSAIRPVDLEALAYADRFNTYSPSGTIAPWIYDRFTTAEWEWNNGEVVIVRSHPMTPRSTPGNIWYQNHGWTPDNSYELTKTFSDGVVEIKIYEVSKFYR